MMAGAKATYYQAWEE